MFKPTTIDQLENGILNVNCSFREEQDTGKVKESKLSSRNFNFLIAQSYKFHMESGSKTKHFC